MRYVVLAVLLMAGSVVSAQETERIGLLNDRLTAAMPKGSQIEARGRSIMAAAESVESETRVVYDQGENRLVVMAWETFQRAGKDFDKQLVAEFEQISNLTGVQYKVTKINEQVTVGVPGEIKVQGDAILYAFAYVRHTDGLVQQIGVFVNPEMHKKTKRCAELADQIVRSIKPGKRKVNTKAGRRVLESLDKQNQLTIQLPDNWVFTTDHGSSFSVHRVQRIAGFGESLPGIGIYVGGHPTYHHQHRSVEVAEKKTRKVPLFGKEVQWIEYTEDGDEDWKNIEYMQEIPGGGGLIIHLWSGAKDDEGLGQMLSILSSVKVEAKDE